MNLDERMKNYERSVGNRLTMRCPAIIRLDGRAFHTFTRSFARPYDNVFRSLMVGTAIAMCEEISTAVYAYGQSDEISILMNDYTLFNTEQYFGGSVQKITSVVSSVATNAFNRELRKHGLHDKLFKATFDARVFSIPERDASNYFVWRQRDCIRNSILSLGQSCFSHKQLHGKSCEDIKNMLAGPSILSPWENESLEFKYGFVVQYETVGGWELSLTREIEVNHIEYLLQPRED